MHFDNARPVSYFSFRLAPVDTDDLNDGKNPQGKEIKNDLHCSVDGYKLLGQRFADKAIELITRKPGAE